MVHNSLSVLVTKSSAHSLYLFPHLKVYYLGQALEHRTKYNRIVGQNCGKKYSDGLMTVFKNRTFEGPKMQMLRTTC
jgi:hypothetical protein